MLTVGERGRRWPGGHSAAPMNIGLFSGTFDPIHRGHLALAQAAQERFDLGRIYFAPTGNPPHKQKQPLAAFAHRYAMVVLATMGEKAFVPSLLEAPGPIPVGAERRARRSDVNYSIDTVQRLKQTLKKADRLFFLIGIDAFNDIAKWHQAEALFRECRIHCGQPSGIFPGRCSQCPAGKAAPQGGGDQAVRQAARDRETWCCRGPPCICWTECSRMFLPPAIREAVSGKKSLAKFVDPAVGEYIKKMGLYQSRAVLEPCARRSIG